MTVRTGDLLRSLTIESRFEGVGPTVDRLMRLCQHRLDGRPDTEELSASVRLGLTEALNNIIEHAYRMQPGNTLTIEVQGSAAKLVFLVRDRGRPMPQSVAEHLESPAAPDPPGIAVEATPALDDLAQGGWGLMLIRSSMDRVRVMREGGENIHLLEKSLIGGAAGGTAAEEI